MRKRFLSKLGLTAMLLGALCFATSCGKKAVEEEKVNAETEADADGTVHLLNGFESVADLYSFKPTVTSTVAAMDINTDEAFVKEGKGSLYYEYQSGVWPEMLLFIEQSDYPEFDKGNLKQINLSVYNASEQTTNATMSVIMEGNVSLMADTFEMKAGEWTDIAFRLSAIACKYNKEKIIGFSVRLETDEAAKFYLDNWSVTMGAENTEEDDLYEPMVQSIVERIEALPTEITVADGEAIEGIYTDYALLPELYRNIIPNYDVLVAAISAYTNAKYMAEEDALERKFLAFDEFYGVGQIENDMNGRYPIFYQTDVAFEEEKGSTMITFDGASLECYFAYESPLDASRYDYMEISFYNEDEHSNHRKVVYFNWNQRLVLEPNTWGTMRITGEEFRSSGRLIVVTVDEYGNRQNSCGKIYLSGMMAHRRDLLEELKKLPDASSLEMPRDIKYLTLIEKTKELYDKTPELERTALPEDLVANMEACWSKTAGYTTVVDSDLDTMTVGTPDCPCEGEVTTGTDDTYGPVFQLDITKSASGPYAGGFQVTKDLSESSNIFFYIYNPSSTAQNMWLYADGSWKDLGARVLEPGWNEITVPEDVTVSSFIFGLFPENSSVVGQWKISNFYAKSDELVDREQAKEVAALIDALPSPDEVNMPEGLKYVVAIDEARTAYEALTASGQSMISSERKAKLTACIAKIEGYSTAVNAKADEMTVGTPDCVCQGSVTKESDDTYGTVFGLNITGIAGGDYAAGFQLNKSLSGSRNMFFYVYNPKETAQNLYLYADPSWKDLGAKVLNPGWNKIEISNDIKIEHYLFGLFPKGTDAVGQWKITSIYAMSDTLVMTQAAENASALIDALPSPDEVNMPEGLKYVAAIDEARAAYEALSDEGKSMISEERKAKLTACVEKIAGYTAAVNVKSDEITVGTPDCLCQGTVSQIEDETYGTVIGLDITVAADGDYAAGFQINKELSNSSNLFFYVYNPKETAQNLYLYADPSWKDLGAKVLNPGWNKIEISDDIKIEQYLFGLMPKDSDVVGQWKITSIYELSDTLVTNEDVKKVEKLIQALPAAKKITMPDDLKQVALIEEAKAFYDALSAEGKELISAANRTKLTDCVKKIKGYQAVVNARTDEMMVGTPDCVCQGTLTTATDKTYGPVFDLKITKAASGDYAAGFQIEKDLSGSKNMYCYIYNPQKSAQNLYLYADPTWKDLGARVLNPGWNKIELSNDIKIEQYIFGLMPKGSDAVGQWKMTSIYALSDSIVAKEEAKATNALIKALPEAKKITMPDDLKQVALIEEAKASYDALSAEGKKQITSANKTKLTDCVKKIKGYQAVVNARMDEMMVGTPDCICQGTLTRSTDKTYGPVFNLKITKAASGDYAAGFQIEKDLSDSKHMYFYIYNPQKSAQNLYLYADPTWKDLGARVLNPGWNKIELSDDIKIEQYIFGLMPKGSDAVGQWKMTSIYALSDTIVAKEEAKETNALIKALPAAKKITMPDDLKYVALIEEAKAAYDALSAEGKKQISATNKTKLTDCVKKIKGYQAVVNARMDEMMVGTPDCVCQGTLTRKTDKTYGPVFELNITAANTGANAEAYAGGFQINKDLSGSKNIFFYLYNPQATAQTMFLYADGEWKDLGTQTLEPGWNKISIPNDKTVSQFVFGLFQAGANAVGKWKLTSFYEVVNNELVKEVKAKIKALPEAADLTWEKAAEVEAAKALYDTMSEKEKTYLKDAEKKKLKACVAKLPDLEAEKVAGMIEALPAADTITEPMKLADVAAIHKAKTAFDGLSKKDKAKITKAQKTKLNECFAKVDAYTILVDAETDAMTVGTPDCKCEGSLTRETDSEYGPVFGLNITAANTGANAEAYVGGFKVDKDLSGSKNIFFYLYNPQSTAQTMFLYGDGNWKDLGTQTLQPGWNKISIPNDKTVNSFVFGLFQIGADVVGEWKITGFYEVVNKELVEEVKAKINALPEAADLTWEKAAEVEAAKALYDTMSEKEKAYLTDAQQKKLNACVAKLPDLAAEKVVGMIDALPAADTITNSVKLADVAAIHKAKTEFDGLSTADKAKLTDAQKTKLNECFAKVDAYTILVDAETDAMTVGTPDCKCEGSLTRETDSEYGPVFGLNITAANTGANAEAYVGGFKVDKDLSGSKNIFFYMYNPQSTAQTMFLYGDGNWKNLGTQTLQPGWNKISIPNDTTVSNFVFGLFQIGADVVGEWKITGFYAVSD